MIEELKLELELEERDTRREERNKPKDKTKKKKGLWDKIFNKNKLKKPNKVAVLYLRVNGKAEPMEVESNNGFFNINGRTYHENRDCVYLLGKEKYPLALIPEGNVLPLGRKSWEDKDMQEKFSILQDHVMKGIRHAERVRMGEKGRDIKFNAKTAIGIGILAIIGLAVIMSYI